MAAIRIKPVDTLAKKFVARGVAASPDYQAGVQAAPDQAQATLAAAATWAAAMQQSIANKSFEKGVAASGNEKWMRNTLSKGVQRFAGGIQQAGGDWAKGFQPFAAGLEGMQLPVKGPKGDPGNNARSVAVQQKLRAIKLGNP